MSDFKKGDIDGMKAYKHLYNEAVRNNIKSRSVSEMRDESFFFSTLEFLRSPSKRFDTLVACFREDALIYIIST